MASSLKVETIKSLTGNEAMTIDESGVPLLQVPAFSAYMDSNVNLTSAVVTPLVFPEENFDTNGWYNTSTGLFTPTIPGYYQITASLRMLGTNLTRSIIRLYINDVNTLPAQTDYLPGTTTSSASSVSTLVYLNGSDGIYVAVYQQGTSPYVLGDQDPYDSPSRFSGFLVRGA